MNITDVDASKVRFNLGELMNQVYYGGTQVRINRRKKAMVRLVSEPFMQELSKLIDYIIEKEPALADTLTLILDDNSRQKIEQSAKEADNGKKVPLESILND